MGRPASSSSERWYESRSGVSNLVAQRLAARQSTTAHGTIRVNLDILERLWHRVVRVHVRGRLVSMCVVVVVAVAVAVRMVMRMRVSMIVFHLHETLTARQQRL